MIDEKKITEAAHQHMLGEYYDNGNWAFPCDTEDIKSQCELDFIKGIGWFKETIWHDASERPAEGEQIIYIVKDEDEIVDAKITITALYDFIPWNEVVSDFNISKWCYLADLLPKGGEK
jgi:hypothetical protein